MNYKSKSDFYAWCRLRNIEDTDVARSHYNKLSGKRDHNSILRRKLRKELGPGRFWAPTSGGVMLNQKYRHNQPQNEE